MKFFRTALLCLFLAGAILTPRIGGFQATAGAQTAAAQHMCTIDHSQPSDGENALAKEDYDAALAFYRDAVAKSPDSQDARLGLVRSLVGKDMTAEAMKQAAEGVAKYPQSSLAKVAAGEAAFRNADFIAAMDDATTALKLDSCDARAMDLLAEQYEISAYYATAARLITLAHRLRPNDEFIRRDWIFSLPRKQRAEELSKYLDGPASLSKDNRDGLQMVQDHLKARKPGECRITSSSESMKIPFVAIKDEDAVSFKAFGLNVAFNGKVRHMQIDTGASGITLSYEAAKRLGLTPEYRLRTGGVGDDGPTSSYLTHVANITIGGVQFSDCIVDVLQKSKWDTRLDVDGLIGLDFFSHWLATLNYPDRNLTLNPLPPRPGDAAKGPAKAADGSSVAADDDDETLHDAIVPDSLKGWMHIIRIGHNIMLPSKLNGGALHYMIMDTGADLSMLSLAYAKEAGKVRIADEMEVTGISGKVKKVYGVDHVTLQFGPVQLPPEFYYSFDLSKQSHDEGVEISGLAGLPTLSRLTISVDYRDNLMLMKYDPNHDPIKYLQVPMQ